MSRYGQQFGPDFTFLGVPMCDLKGTTHTSAETGGTPLGAWTRCV